MDGHTMYPTEAEGLANHPDRAQYIASCDHCAYNVLVL